MNPWLPSHDVVHRREFADYQGLWQDLAHAPVLSAAALADFTFKHGEVWMRFNRLTKGKGGATVRIVALFSTLPLRQFGDLLLVACTASRQPPRTIWRTPDLPDDPTADHLQDLFARHAGRAMVALPWLATSPVAA